MTELFDDPRLIQESGTQIGSYNRKSIRQITLNDEPFLLTGEAWVMKDGESTEEFDTILTFSTVSEADCAGHFGPKFPKGRENLKIPLLHLSRTMVIAAQIAARIRYPDQIPVVIAADNVRANNQNLIPPPAGVTARAINFVARQKTFSAQTFAKANGDPYAEIEKLSFQLVADDKFERESHITTEIPDELLRGYEVEKEMYHSEIEELILERFPFHRLDKALLLKSGRGDMKVITTSKITSDDCAGQLVIGEKPTVSLIDYSRLMALTAELLASIVTRERYDGFSVVPIAVRVDKISTLNPTFFSPPITVVTEAYLSAETLSDPRRVKRGRKLFWADTARVWVGERSVAEMEQIVYALVPEEGFFENA